MSGGPWPLASGQQDDLDMQGLTSPASSAPMASPSALLHSATSSSATSGPPAPSQMRFPSTFADFRLPTSPSSSLSPAQDGAGSPGRLSVGGAGIDTYPLFNNRRLRRGSTLSLVNHRLDDGADEPAQALPAGPFNFVSPPPPPPIHHHLGPPARPQTPPNLSGQATYRPSSSSSSTMAISPASSKARLRSASPPAVPTLNPPQFRDSSSAAALPRHPISRLGMQRNHSFTGIRNSSSSSSKGKGREHDSESPSEPEDHSPVLSAATPALRPITRRGSLYPKHLAHISTAKMLNEDPVDSEIKSEAQIQRLLQSQSSAPASSRLRQSHAALASARGRFPEDADDGDSDIFGSAKGGSSSSSSDDDFGMEDDPEPAPPAPPPNSVTPALGQHFPRGFPAAAAPSTSTFGMALHAALAANPPALSATAATNPLVSASGLLTHRAANLSGSFSGSDGDALMGGVGSPKSTTASPVGGWRETGTGRVNKRKAADEVSPFCLLPALARPNLS